MSRTPAAQRGLVAASVMAATLMQTLDSTIANVALPHMQGGLGASQEQISWVLTSYIVAAAIATAPTGFLAQRYGRKRVFLTAVVGFTLASMLCGLATSLPQIVAFRLLQGLCGASLVPLSQLVLLDTYPKEQHGAAMSLWGMGVMVGPIIGPTLGGWLTETYSWRWVFYINLPVGILAFMGLSAALPADAPKRGLRLDGLGFALLSLAIASLQLMLDRGETQDWFGSPEIVLEAAAAALAFYLFVVHTLTARAPFLSPRLFADRNFVTGLVMIGMVGVVLFATAALLPPFLQNLRGFPVILTGLVIAPRGVGTMVAMKLVPKVIDRWGARLPIAAGLIATAASLHWMTQFNLDVPIWELVVSGVIQGAGLGLVFVPLSTLTFATLAPEHRGDATALFSLVRNIGSSIGIAMTFAFLSQNSQAAHARLVEHINPFNPALAEYANAAGGLGSSAGLLTLEQEVQRQASLLATLTDFQWMMFGVLLVLPLVLLFRSPRRPAAPVEALID
jgi:DHA2 family multidrug resistance protein